VTREEIQKFLQESREEVEAELANMPTLDNKKKAAEYAKNEWFTVKKVLNWLNDHAGIDVPDEVRAQYYQALEEEKLSYIEAKQEREEQFDVPVALR